jgi:hypothetical protein
MAAARTAALCMRCRPPLVLPLPTAAAEPCPACCFRAQGAAAVESSSPTDYEAIASTAPFLTRLSLELPDSATALPHEMAGLLSACSRLEDLEILALDAYDETRRASLVDISAFAQGTQLMSLQLPSWSNLTNLAPLGALGSSEPAEPQPVALQLGV